jgi:hypothetical protein
MAILDVLGTVSTPTPRSTRRQRHDWVRGEVRCLMCGRLVGRLLGTARPRDDGDRSAGQPVAFLAFRPLEPTGAIVPFRPGLRFRCDHCGGAGALDSVDLFSTYDEVATQEQSDMSDAPRGPGRPRRELDLSRVGPTGLAAALNEV